LEFGGLDFTQALEISFLSPEPFFILTPKDHGLGYGRIRSLAVGMSPHRGIKSGITSLPVVPHHLTPTSVNRSSLTEGPLWPKMIFIGWL
jgi:hypothetical protein